MSSPNSKPLAGSQFPDIRWSTVGGSLIAPADASGWRLVVVYRGKHCPLCEKYLDTLNGLSSSFDEAGIKLIAVSADPLEKAKAQVDSQSLTFPVAYDLSIEQMHQLGLYVSEPRSAEETDRPFAEPGTFVINPRGELQIIDISNAPFARPDAEALLKGIKFVQEKNYPIRGTLG